MRLLRKTTIRPGQKVILRSDFDVPLENGKITNTLRLEAALPSIKFLLQKQAQIIIISHLGRPNGEIVEGLSFDPVIRWLKENLKVKIAKLEYIRRPRLKSGQVFLLENIRFYPGEEKNDVNFAKQLASLGEIFVNDAFAVCHRQHASIVGLPRYLPSLAGFQLEKEVSGLKKALGAKKDLVVILGGAKTETKIPVIKEVIGKGAIVLLGGLVGNTFLAAFLKKRSLDAKPIIEAERKMAQDFLMTLDKEIGFAHLPGKTTQIWLPLDLWVAGPGDKQFQLVDFSDQITTSLPQDKQVYGLGPKALKHYAGLVALAKVIVMNGPLSRPHKTAGDPRSTAILGKAISQSKAFSIVGGGDTVAALAKENLLAKMGLVSTGGGAMLEYLSKGALPGVKALEK